MAVRKLLNEKTGELEDVEDSLVERYINRGGYRFNPGDKIPVQSGGSAYHLLDADEAYNYIRSDNARYMNFEEYEKKRDEADFTDFGGDMAAAALGAVEYIGTPLATAALGVAGDIGAEYLNKWFDLGLGSASDYITKSAEYNPWWYHGTGVLGTVGVGALVGAGAGTVVAPGVGTVGGAVAGGAAGATKAGAQRAAMAGAAATARAAEMGRLRNLWDAIAGASKVQKLGRAAEMTPVGWTMKMSNMTRNQLTKTLSDGKVNAALSKINPSLANMFKSTIPSGKDAAQVAFATTATAGMVTAAAEGAVFWGPATAAKEMLLSNEERTLGDAAGFIFEQMMMNAFVGAAFSGAIDVGLKGAVWGGQKGMDTAGKAYHWMGETGVGQTANDWWRAGAKNFSGMDAEGQANLDFAFQSGKEGYENRQAILYMKEFYGKVVDRFKRTTNMMWVVQDFVEQVDIGGSYKPEFVNATLKEGIAKGHISGDYVPAAADAVDTLVLLERNFEDMLGAMKAEPGRPKADPRIVESFRSLVENARANIGRGVVEESRTVTKATDADELLVQEAKDWYSSNRDRLRQAFIDQYGFIFEDPNAMVRTATGRRPRWFDEDALEDLGEGQEALGASTRGGVLEEEAELASSDYIDRTGLRIIDEDEMVLTQHPDYDPETGKVLVPHEERNRLWSQILGIRPLKEATDVNVNGQRFTYVHKIGRWMDSRGNYLQSDPERHVWSKSDLPAHRAPFDQNFIDIGGQITQNPVQYEHYVDKKTGKVVRKWGKSREAFEDVQDKRPRHYPHAPPHLSDAKRHHFSQKLKDVEDEVASLQNAAKVVEQQIEAIRTGAPVPMTRFGRFDVANSESATRFALLAESGVPEQLRKLNEGIDVARNNLEKYLRENPPAKASDFKDLPKDQASIKAMRSRAERFKRIKEATFPLKELRRQRRELELSADPDLETILEIQNPRASEESLLMGDDLLGRAQHLSIEEAEEVFSRLNDIPDDALSAMEDFAGDPDSFRSWVARLSDDVTRSTDELIEAAHNYGLYGHVDDARSLLAEVLDHAERVKLYGGNAVEDLRISTDSFPGKKKLIKALKKQVEGASSRLMGFHELLEGVVKTHDARSKSPASVQHTLDVYLKRKQAVRAELKAKQRDAAALEEQLAALPKVAPRGRGNKAAEKHAAELSKQHLAFREADRALKEHDAELNTVYKDAASVEQELIRVKGLVENAPTKEVKREAKAIEKELSKKHKALSKRAKKIDNRRHRKERERLDSARWWAQEELWKAEKAGNLEAAPAPIPLETDGGVVRPSAARLSELSGKNITDAEKATLASFQYYPGGDKGFEAVGRRKTYGPDKGAIVYDDDLIHLLETVRRSHEKGFKIKQAAPGRSPGRSIADELGPDPGRGEIGTPAPRHIDDEAPARTRFVLKDEKGALVPQPKGLGYEDTRFGIEGQPIDVFVEPQAPPPPPLEKFDELMAKAIDTGDATELENLMLAMGFFDDIERVTKKVDKPGIQSYDEFWGFRKKPAERLMPTEKRHSVADIKAAIERVKNPEKEVVSVQSQLVKDIERAMMESRASHNASEWGDELATRLAEEDRFFQFAISEARETGNLTHIMELAGKYGVQVKSSEMLSDLFHAMHQLKNELHYTHSHQHVGKDGAQIFEESADLVEQFLMGAAPRPAQAAYPQRRNHFGNAQAGTGMSGVMGRYGQQMSKAQSLRQMLASQIGEQDPHAPSPAALRSSEEKIRDWLLSTNKENVSYQMENIRAYMNKNDEILTDIFMMFDAGKFDIRNTRKMNEALEAAGLGPAKDSREAFSKIRRFIKEGRSEMNGLNSQINSRKFQAQIELGVKAGGGSSWISSLGPLGGLSFGAFLLHPAAAGVVAAGGITMMNPRSTAIRLAQMERMATNFHKKIQDKTNRFIYDTVTGKDLQGYRQGLVRSLIGPSAPLRNQGELEEYQRKASERQIASDEFLKTREFITNLVHNERAMVQFIDRAVPPGLDDYAPTVRKHMQDRLRIKMMAAYETMPKTFSSEFMSTDALPSTMEMSKWARDLQAIQDPLGTLIEGLSSGSLTKAEVQMVQKTAPEVYQETVRRIVEGLSDPMIRDRVPYKTKVQLTTLLGVRFTKPSTIRALQQAFQREEKKKEQQQFNRVMQSTQQSAGSTIDTVERSQ